MHNPADPAITIRPARSDDLDTIVRFNAALAMQTESRKLDEATLRAGVRRGLDNPQACQYVMAERGGRVIGQLMLTYELSDWRDGVFWWIQSVYVEPAARRGGVFRALYEHVHDTARSDVDCCGIRLYVEHENVRAIATYESLGMKHAGYHVFECDFAEPGAG